MNFGIPIFPSLVHFFALFIAGLNLDQSPSIKKQFLFFQKKRPPGSLKQHGSAKHGIHRSWIPRSGLTRSSFRVPPSPPSSRVFIFRVQMLPMVTRSAMAKGTDLDCPICLGSFRVGDNIRSIGSCGHTFHRACIQGNVVVSRVSGFSAWTRPEIQIYQFDKLSLHWYRSLAASPC